MVVIRMPGTPFLLALQHNLVVSRVVRNFFAMIIGAPLTLTLELTADFLLRTIHGRQKRSLAVRTTARLAQTGSSVDCEMNLRGKDKLAKQSTQFRNCCRVLYRVLDNGGSLWMFPQWRRGSDLDRRKWLRFSSASTLRGQSCGQPHSRIARQRGMRRHYSCSRKLL